MQRNSIEGKKEKSREIDSIDVRIANVFPSEMALSCLFSASLHFAAQGDGMKTDIHLNAPKQHQAANIFST